MNVHPVRRRESRAVIELLSVLVALVALLVVAVAAGGIYAYREYRQLTARVGQAVGASAEGDASAKEPTALAQALSELNDRQATTAKRLAAVAAKTGQDTQALEDRLDAMRTVAQGPIDKIEQTIRLQQLLADEMLVMLRHLGQTQDVLADGLRPLPLQRELSRREGVGGSGSGNEPE